MPVAVSNGLGRSVFLGPQDAEGQSSWRAESAPGIALIDQLCTEDDGAGNGFGGPF
jgi:hypothetical protein